MKALELQNGFLFIPFIFLVDAAYVSCSNVTVTTKLVRKILRQ
jgi:hypothetical protein